MLRRALESTDFLMAMDRDSRDPLTLSVVPSSLTNATEQVAGGGQGGAP